jgi:hypothetical protein
MKPNLTACFAARLKSPRIEISMSSPGGISMKKLIGVLNCAFLVCLLVGCGGGVGRPLSQPVTIISLAPPDGTLGASYAERKGSPLLPVEAHHRTRGVGLRQQAPLFLPV